MTDKPLSDKRQHFVNEYCSNGHNASKAYHIAYPDCKVGWDKLAVRMMGYDVIEQAIRGKMAELEAKIGHNYEIAVEMLRERIGWLNAMAEKGNVQAIQAQTAIIRELDDITGLHKQTIITEPQQRELNEAQTTEAIKIANYLNHQGVA